MGHWSNHRKSRHNQQYVHALGISHLCVVVCLQEEVLKEQKRACHVTDDSEWPPLDYDVVKELQLLDRCLKETLRLRPPIMTMMRMCKTPQVCSVYMMCVVCCVCVGRGGGEREGTDLHHECVFPSILYICHCLNVLLLFMKRWALGWIWWCFHLELFD